MDPEPLERKTSPTARLLLGIHLAAGPLAALFGIGAIVGVVASGGTLPLPLFVAVVAPGMALGLLPSSVAMIACGVLHGWFGAAALFPALVVAAVPGFLAVRRVFRAEAREALKRHPAAHAAVERLERRTFSVATLLRIAPVSTFALTNALLATSGIGTGAYVATTALGLLPRLLLLTWTGSSGRDLATILHGSTTGSAPLLGLGFSVASLLALGWIGFRLLRSEERFRSP